MHRLAQTAQHMKAGAEPAAAAAEGQAAGVTLLPSTTSAEQLRLDASKLGQLYRYAETMVASGATPGLCMAIGRGGRQLPPRAWGRSGPDAGEEVNQGLTPDAELRPDSIFLVASVTKPVVVTAVMQLVQQGLLSSLDAPVFSILPAFAEHGNDDPLGFARTQVTVRHLLTHTSGLPDAIPENHELRLNQSPLSAFSQHMVRAPLLFAPGTNISYSSVALNVLGDIIEALNGGVPLPVQLKQRIFEPLGLRDTTLGIAADRQKPREVCLNLAAGSYLPLHGGLS